LLAERSVFSFVFFEGHGSFILAGREFEQLAALSDVPALRSPNGRLLTGRFVNVPAVEIPRLLAFDEFADRIAPEVPPFGRPIERGAFGRRVADEHQRIQSRESIEALRQFLLAVLARRIEGRWVRIAESCDMIPLDLHRASMKIVEAELAAEASNICFRFVIARKDVHPLRVLLQNRPRGLQATPKISQVAGGEVIVRFDGHQFFERGPVAVNIGEDEEFH
jgi:hypothetical protein